MSYIKSFFKVLLLSIKPLSKASDIWDYKDIINLIILLLYGGGAVLIEQFVHLEWFRISYLAFIPALLLLIAACKLQRKADDIDSKRPRLIFMNGGTSEGIMYHQKQFVSPNQDIDRTEPISANTYFVFAFVKNDPIEHMGDIQTAKSAAPTVCIYSTNNLQKPILSFWGHWREKPQVTTRLKYDSFPDGYLELDLKPNKIPHRIDFALKHDQDECMYAYNDESHRYSPDGRYEKFKLDLKQYFVKISISANNISKEQSGWYEIQNNGAFVKPTIRQLSSIELVRLVIN
ncbi:MAG: hypothetical protein PHO26_05095 [Dehalococcoidia bacterium]|nr:hypothetical protein [Dehalococcoidia bacterium]MDD5494418.1 hypothetical protein [Dehalococcoidia bacterium]